VQGSLIDHRTLQERIAIGFQHDRQTFEPVRPLLTQVTLEPDAIDRALVRSTPPFI
jgi:hypothetical protein